jgi:hypothetical protein
MMSPVSRGALYQLVYGQTDRYLELAKKTMRRPPRSDCYDHSRVMRAILILRAQLNSMAGQ